MDTMEKGLEAVASAWFWEGKKKDTFPDMENLRKGGLRVEGESTVYIPGESRRLFV